jgi:hypothetical protein
MLRMMAYHLVVEFGLLEAVLVLVGVEMVNVVETI